MVMKGWLLDDDYIVWTIISYFGISMVWAFMYEQIKCKKNKYLGQYIDIFMIETVHEITEISKDRNLVLTFPLWSSYYFSMMNRL